MSKNHEVEVTSRLASHGYQLIWLWSDANFCLYALRHGTTLCGGGSFKGRENALDSLEKFLVDLDGHSPNLHLSSNAK